MIGIDTNVFIRFLVDEADSDQSKKAKQFIAERTDNDPAFVSAVVLAETVWLLNRHLKFPVETVVSALRSLFSTNEFEFEYRRQILEVLNAPVKRKVDIADHLISFASRFHQCSKTVTFDKAAAKHIPHMELLS